MKVNVYSQDAVSAIKQEMEPMYVGEWVETTQVKRDANSVPMPSAVVINHEDGTVEAVSFRRIQVCEDYFVTPEPLDNAVVHETTNVVNVASDPVEPVAADPAPAGAAQPAPVKAPVKDPAPKKTTAKPAAKVNDNKK